MASVICFGPNESYFFNSPTQWSYHNLPPELTNLLISQPKIKDVHEMALGPNGSYLIVYTDAHGKQMLSHSGLPETLRNWLVPQAGHGVVRDLLSLNVALDAFGGFFAFDKTSSIRDRLSPAFEAACQQRMNPQGQWLDGQFPENVSFGPNGAYVMVTRGGGGAWNFNGQLQDLQNFLQQQKSLTGVYPILSPYNSNVHATCFANGHTWASVPTYCLPQFQVFEADFKAACQRATAQRTTQPHPQQAHVQQHHVQQHPVQQHPHPQQTHPQQVRPQQAHPQQTHPQQTHPQQAHARPATHPQQHPHPHPQQQAHPQHQGGAQGQQQPTTAQTALQVMKNVNTGLKLMNGITGALTGGNANNNNNAGGLFPNFNFNTNNNN